MGLDICHIRLIEKNENSLDYLCKNDFSENPQFLEKHKNKIVSSDDGEIIFYEDLGHIRKQVNPKYQNEFINDKLYFKKNEVEKLKKYLKSNQHENQKQLENYFDTNFINNFVEGESIFFLSN